MKPNVRRILWMLVVAALALSGLSACSYSSLFGAGAGLSLAGIVTALLLLFGTTTQTGCSACLSIHACLSPPSPADVGACLSPDAQVGPCLSQPLPTDASVGPCLAADAHVGPCLSPPAPDTGVGVCLSIEPPDGGVGPCLSPPIDPPDADLGPCLSPPPPDASAESRDFTKPAHQTVAAADRQQILERLQDRLPDDVKDRLGLKKA